METNSLVPKLRFKDEDGKDFPDWSFIPLNEVFEKSGIKNKENKIKSVLTNSAFKGIINQNEYFDRDIVSENNLRGYYVVDINDFIYNPRISKEAPVGPLKRNKLRLGIMSPLYTVLKPKKGNLEFLEHYFDSTRWHKYMKSIANYGARHDRMNITTKGFENLPIPFPSQTEQNKIASFLTSVDKKINLLTKKKALLETYKKGVMQKIFSQEIRFKDEDGKDFPDWTKIQLSDIAERIKRKNKRNNENVLTISAQLGLISQLQYFKKSVASKNLSNYTFLERDDFAYNKSYSKDYPMGAIKRLKKYDNGVVSSLYICFKLKNKASVSFIEQYFNYGLQNNEIKKVAQEGARNHGLLNIGINEFFQIYLKTPSLKEQNKIASFLSNINKKIELVDFQLERNKEFKKGLLQQMFV